MVVLDTNIIIDHLRQKRDKQTELMRIAEEMGSDNLALSTISIQELYEGRSTREKSKELQLLLTISPLRTLPYNYEIAELAGKIARDLKNSIEFADVAIAATAIVYHFELFTLNRKHFEKIPNLELL